ncbi:PXMP2/4 family protein 4-like [Homarus americanus]|uniref:PXMP2/4 family protein 4-like n=1 Tax=Homarus americanus TaxID=6706 RepID=A0A8J5JL11_HOMAM|nr:PXMP2/4 family protein 4-like [Homarus americanus]
MAKLLKVIRKVGEQYPVLRGMVTYSVLWPTSNVVQQSLDKTRDRYDPIESLRYLIFGTFGTAPTVYVWVKLASKIIRGNTLRHAVMKVGVCFWPVVQTINFAYVAEKNRVVVVSMASFLWTIFLSYMHHLDQESLPVFLRKNTNVSNVKQNPVGDSAPASSSHRKWDGDDTKDIL